MIENAENRQQPELVTAVSTLEHEPPSRSQLLEGIVVAIAPGFFEVASAQSAQEVYLCTLRGRLRKSRGSLARAARPPQNAKRSQHQSAATEKDAAPQASETTPVRIAPGDRVLITLLGGDKGVIEEVLPRRTALSRARSESGEEHIMLANLDQAVLVFAVRDPLPHFGMLDRYLALCEHAGIAATICLNKVDLDILPEVEAAVTLYRGLGYSLLYTSAATQVGIEELRHSLRDRTSLLTGPSGVGKSSLMNVLLPEANQRTGEISDATGKGRHTTTGVRLLPLPEGGWLADSAGIRELALWNVPSDELAQTFIELRPVADNCLYENCDHSEGEEGCALRETLAEGKITVERFASFERLLAEAREAEAPRW